MPLVFLGLGANAGDRIAGLEQAVAALCVLGPVRRSGWYETEPVGVPGSPTFVNGVVSLDTSEPPDRLLAAAMAIERGLGRDEKRRAGPRPIDIDILLYGHEVIAEPGLVVPHPRMHERAFVLVPLCELAPDVVHPKLGRTARELLSGIDQSGVRRCCAS